MKSRQWIAIGVVGALVGVAVFGLWLAKSTKPAAPIQEVIVIRTIADGFTPLQVEFAVTSPIEQNISRLDGVGGVDSVSRAGESVIEARVSPNADPVKVRDAVLGALPTQQLPDGISTPLVLTIAKSQVRWMWLDKADDAKRTRLEAIDGVRAVSPCGDKQRVVRVVLDEARLAALHLEAHDVVEALEQPKIVFAELANTPVKTARIADVATVEAKEFGLCRATRKGVEGVLLTIDTGAKLPATDAKLRAEGTVLGIEEDAFRIDFGPGVPAGEVDRLVREAGAKDAIVLEHPDASNAMVADAAVVLASDICAVAAKLEYPFASRTPVRIHACAFDDDGRALRFVGPDLEVLTKAAKGALDLAKGQGALAFMEGHEKGPVTNVELEPDATLEDRVRLNEAQRMQSHGITVSVTETGDSIVVALPPGPLKIAHTVSNVAQMPIVVEHVNNHRAVRVRFTGENARETATWVAERVAVPPGVLVLTR